MNLNLTTKQRHAYYKEALDVITDKYKTFMCPAIRHVKKYTIEDNEVYKNFPELYLFRPTRNMPKNCTEAWNLEQNHDVEYNFERKIILEFCILMTKP